MKKKSKFTKLKPEELRWRSNLTSKDLSAIEEQNSLDQIIGQDRALKALQIGTELFADGYNVFISGLSGTGRLTTVKKILEDISPESPLAPDRCYVNNFINPENPRLITLSRGQARVFQEDMNSFIDYAIKNLSAVFETENYLNQNKEITENFTETQKNLFKEFEKKIEKDGLVMVQVKTGNMIIPDIYPMIKGQPVPIENIEEMIAKGELKKDDVDLDAIEEKLSEYKIEMDKLLRHGRKLARELEEWIINLDKVTGKKVISGAIEDIKDKYSHSEINAYLDEVENDILNSLHLFREKEDGSMPKNKKNSGRDVYYKYRVNVILDNSNRPESPVIVETNPTFKNIFGWIEKTHDKYGTWRTDFMHIKSGSLLKADGGYLIINAIDTLLEPNVWVYLKRVLKYKKLEIQSQESFYQLDSVRLKPEQIDLNTKIIMIGDEEVYHTLYHNDSDFKKIFKIKADFESVMKLDDHNVKQYATFIRHICTKNKFRPFDNSAINSIIEYGARLGGSQKKLSTRFGLIADLIREANYWGKKDNVKEITADYVDKAIEEKINRLCKIEDRIQEMIDDNTIMIDVDGERIGVINGLSVYDLGSYAFGKPTRITSTISMGKAGILNIEREAKLSGKTHDKGVLILSSYLKEQFSQEKPLSITISICFEQSYSGIDGDSASSTEIFCILSCLSELPLAQSIAVTGSVNQKGEIQAIGGVNQKIEGFYEVCKAKGLNGKQGVIIPVQNIKDLMLKNEVIDAVKDKKFSIYPIKTIDEGIEILTGVEAGKRDKDEKFPEETVYYRVEKKLNEMYEKSKKAEKKSGKNDGKNDENES